MAKTGFGTTTLDMRRNRRTQFIPSPAVLGAFRPTDITGLVFWLDADDADTIDDSTATPDVDQWNDKGGSGMHVSQGTAGSKPHTGGTQNGRNTIIFDGVDDWLEHNSATEIFDTTEGDVFIVGRFASFAEGITTMMTWQKIDTTIPRLMFKPFTNSVRNKISVDWDNTDKIFGSTALSVDTHYLYHIRGAGSAYDLRLNSTEETENVDSGANNGNWPGDNATNDTKQITIGAVMAAADNPVFEHNGEIAEIVVYNNQISAEDLTLLEAYFNDKWGLGF